MKIIGYYTSWSIYGRNFFPKDLPLTNLTHVTLAFAIPEANGQLNTEELRKIMFKRDGKVKIGVAIGGWGTFDSFSKAIASNAKQFIDSCVNLVCEFELDYLELDWEYPQTNEQTEQLKNVLINLKLSLPEETELSVCLPCFKSEFKVKELNPFVDLFVLMAYDLAGPWSKVSDHHSSLFPAIAEHFDYLTTSEGVAKEKTILGCPLYGRTFANCHGLNEKFSGPGMGSFGEEGAIDYKDCVEKCKCKDWIYDPRRVSYYAVNAGDLITFDGPESMKRKCEWTLEAGIGGLAFWHVAADALDDNSLIKVASEALNRVE